MLVVEVAQPGAIMPTAAAMATFLMRLAPLDCGMTGMVPGLCDQRTRMRQSCLFAEATYSAGNPA